jgi:4-hydroxymandelate oxidase
VPTSGLPIVAEAERRARDLLPATVWDYFAGGSGSEITLEESVTAWQRHRLLPHVLRDVSTLSTATTVLGTPVSSPVLLAPTAFCAMAHPEGEVASARGTAAAGGLMVVSSRSSFPLEDVAAAAGGPWWFQAYVMRDRDLTEGLLRRADAAGARAVVLTGDTPYVGVKHRLTGPLPIPDQPERSDQDPATTLADIGWLREVSGLPVVVKGVLRPDDALACLDAGAAGVVVSTHGGRQLDRAVSTAQALPGVVTAVAGRAEVYVDGGIRDGVSILIALALGARAVLVGRPAIWALATGGADGVAALLRALGDDLSNAMALAGVPDIDGIDRDLVL